MRQYCCYCSVLRQDLDTLQEWVVQRFSAIPDKGGVSGVPAQRVNAPPVKPATATTADTAVRDTETTAGDDSSSATTAGAAEQSDLTAVKGDADSSSATAAGAAAAEQSEPAAASGDADSSSSAKKSSSTVPFTSAELQKRLRVVPVKDLRQVCAHFILTVNSVQVCESFNECKHKRC
jgi:hypothetical protein